MLAILNPFMEIFQLVANTAHYILILSYLLGKGIYFVLCQISIWIGAFFQGLAVVIEELWLFVRELHLSINETVTYIESSSNRGVGVVVDGISKFAAEMGRFFSNGKLHSKLLASAAGRCVVDFLNVIRGGLLFIADSVWYLLTIIPKTLLAAFIYVGDLIVFGIDAMWRMSLRFAQNVVDEIFRYTIAIVVIFLVLRNRRRIGRATRRLINWIILFTIRWTVRAYTFFFVLHSAPPPTRQRIIEPLPRRSPYSNGVHNKSNESNCCVVCRDRPKCVLLLPCKHLCMCEECAEFIARRNAFCPLCRSTVHKQLSVYI